MRVTRIPGDSSDIGARPCRVFCNENEIQDWSVADDFRRVVETPGGAFFGAVRIDLLPAVNEVVEEVDAAPVQAPSSGQSNRKKRRGR